MTGACPKTEDLYAYVDSQLSVSERTRVDAHLATCASCRALLGELRGLRADFQALPDLRLGFDLAQVIRGRLAAQPTPATVSRAPRWRRFLPAGIGAAVSLSLGLTMGLSLTAPVAVVAPIAGALQVFAPIAPGGLCVGLRACGRPGATTQLQAR